MTDRPEAHRVPLEFGTPAARLVVVRAQCGDRAALNQLLHALQGTLWSHARLIVRDDDLAGDVLQQSLLTIARKLPALRDPRWIRAWAVRITTREATRQASRSRHHARQAADSDLLDAIAAPVEEPRFEPELVSAIPALVTDLPAACQAVVRLRYLEELSVSEIAEGLEIPEGTVKSRLAYGLARLRERVAPLA